MNNSSPFKENLLEKKKNAVKCIWWMNIGIEETWSAVQGCIVPRLTDKRFSSTASKSEQMCLMLADNNDAIIVRDKVPFIVLDSLAKAGFHLPEIWDLAEWGAAEGTSVSELILKDCDVINRLKNLKRIYDEVYLVPYVVTSKEIEIAAITGCKIAGSLPEVVEWTNNKVNARLLAMEAGLPVTEGFICRSVDEILAAINQLKKSGCEKIVMKDAYGASGKGLYMVDTEKSMELLSQILFRKKNSKKNIEVIAERWYDTKVDINYQVFIRNDGTIAFIPPKRQILSGVIYKGSEFPVDHILSKRQMGICREAANIMGKKLYEKGYRGMASIDSIIAKDDTVFPVVEINGRFSLSTYVSFVPALLGSTGFFTSKYYDVYSDTVTAESLEWLQENNYTPVKGEGLIVYTFAEKAEAMPGRIFILYVYNKLYKLREKEKYVNRFFNRVIT